MEELERIIQNDELLKRAKAFIRRMGKVSSPSDADRAEFQQLRREIWCEQKEAAMKIVRGEQFQGDTQRRRK